MEQETLTAPAESLGTETPSQETPPVSQETAQPQEANTAPVEAVVNQPQNTEPPRRKPSDFYRDRQTIRELRDTVASQNKQLQELATFVQEFKKQNAGASPTKFDLEKFFSDPEPILSQREQKLMEEIEKVRSEISQIRDTQTVSQLEREKREALELLFPKTSADDSTPALDRAESSPERARQIQAIFDDIPSLQQLVDTKPLEAAKIITKMLREEKPQASPKVIPKSLMGGAPKGNPNPGGGKTTRTANDVLAELKKLRDEEAEQPHLRFDAERKKRKEILFAEADRLATEPGK